MDYTDPKIWGATLVATATALGIESVRPKVKGWLETRRQYKKIRDALREYDGTVFHRLQRVTDERDQLHEQYREMLDLARDWEKRFHGVDYQLRVEKAAIEALRSERARSRKRIAELEKNQRVENLVFEANKQQASGSEWWAANEAERERQRLMKKWPHFGVVNKGQAATGWVPPVLEDKQIPSDKIYAPNVVMRPEVVQLLHVEGPYLTVKEQATHPQTGGKIARVFTVFDGNGSLRKRFNDEAPERAT